MRRVFRLMGGARAVEREVDDEIAFHLEMRARKLMEQGHSPESAQREALRQFGDLRAVRERCVTTDRERERTVRRTNYLNELRQDVWQAMRVLRHNPGFAVIVILMLALGIGANTAIFTLVDAVLLRTLPVRDPHELVTIGDPSRTSSFSYSTSPQTSLISYPLYQELRADTSVVHGLVASGLAMRTNVLVDSTDEEPDRARGRFVSGNYFSTLGIGAVAGRTLDAAADAAIGGAPEVTISYAYWQRRFHGDRSAVGRVIRINGNPMTIVGVTPESFTGEIVGAPIDIWLPVTMMDVLNPNSHVLEDRNAHFLLLIGRRRAGVSLAAAREAITTQVRRRFGEHLNKDTSPEDVRTLHVYVSDGSRGLSRVRATFGAPLLTLMAGVGVLLLIVCANVANLLLARSVARAREMTVRVAIGAGRFRIVRQLMTEALVLALLGAAGGLALAWYGSRLLLTLASSGPDAMPIAVLDLPVLGFTVLASVLAVALFGLAPSLSASRIDLASAMRSHARSVTGSGLGRRGRRFSLGQLLIAGQVALSLVLLVGSALLVRSLQQIQRVDTGLDRDHLLIVILDKMARGYTGERTANLTRELTDRIARIPGVQAVSFSENGIFSGSESATSVQVAGFVARTAEDSTANYDHVGPGYVRAIGGHLLQGREFGPEDVAGSERVAMINQSMAAHYFGAGSPLGRYLRFDDSIAVRIVGVVGDIRDHSLDGSPTRRFYLPYQQPMYEEPGALVLAVRTSGDPALAQLPVRAAVRAADPLLSVENARPLSVLIARSIQAERVLARVSSGFGFLALLLASLGLYGVLTYAITRRTGEIGLRVALGAQRSAVVRMVLSDALRLVAVGGVFGVPLAIGGARLLSSQLHGIEAIDPVAMTVALSILLASALAAAMIPALRASKVEPLTALREE